MSHVGEQTFVYEHPPAIISHASIVGPKEGRGPLASWFDTVLEDDLLGQKSWELAEMEMVRRCAKNAMNQAQLSDEDVQAMLGRPEQPDHRIVLRRAHAGHPLYRTVRRMLHLRTGPGNGRHANLGKLP